MADDGICYIVRGFAGYFAYGEWEPKDEEQIVIVEHSESNCCIVPLQPVKFKTRKSTVSDTRSELDCLCCTLFSPSLGECILGKNPWSGQNGHVCVI